MRRSTSVFPFFNHWAEAAGFVDFVASVSNHDQRVSPLVSLMRNLKALKPVLHERFGRHILAQGQDREDRGYF